MLRVVPTIRLSSPLVARSLSTTVQKQRSGPNVVLIEGVRTPFLTAYSDYADLMANDLQRHALL